jgi:prophage DNA circulation protein
MDFCKKLISSCLTGRGRSTIAVFLAMLIAFGLIAPPPAEAQLGAIAIVAAAAAVVGVITNTIGGLLGSANGLLGTINGFVQALANLWGNVVYPVNLINQALMMVNQLVAQFRGLVTAIDHVNVLSATLPNPSALEVIMRNGSVADFGQFDQAFRTTYQPLPPVTDIHPGDLQRLDMSDALAMDTLKALKASDQVVAQTLQASQTIEDQAAQAAPGSAAYLTGAGLIAAVENQAMMQRMLAAELREEAGILAHSNAIRKRQADMASQFRQDTSTLFK